MKNILSRASLMAPLLMVAACNTTSSTDPLVTGSISQNRIATAATLQKGTASWYGPGFHGRRTASGERFNPGAMTAAHRSLPFGTKLKVVNEKNGRSVVVRVNDRGPFARNRNHRSGDGTGPGVGTDIDGNGLRVAPAARLRF